MLLLGGLASVASVPHRRRASRAAEHSWPGANAIGSHPMRPIALQCWCELSAAELGPSGQGATSLLGRVVAHAKEVVRR